MARGPLRFGGGCAAEDAAPGRRAAGVAASGGRHWWPASCGRVVVSARLGAVAFRGSKGGGCCRPGWLELCESGGRHNL
eukprot:10040419-Lingulodinium_polyedra.AAC.1